MLKGIARVWDVILGPKKILQKRRTHAGREGQALTAWLIPGRGEGLSTARDDLRDYVTHEGISYCHL